MSFQNSCRTCWIILIKVETGFQNIKKGFFFAYNEIVHSYLMNKVFLKTIDVIFLGRQNYFDSDGSNLFSKYIIKTLIFLTYIKNGALLNKVVFQKTKVQDVTFLGWQNWQHVFKICIIFNFFSNIQRNSVSTPHDKSISKDQNVFFFYVGK